MDELKEKLLRFVKEGSIRINEKELYELKQRYEKDTFLNALSEVIAEHVNFPFKNYSQYELLSDFNSLKNQNVSVIKQPFITRGEYKYPISNLYIDSNSNGNIASNYFQQKNRYAVAHIDFSNSPLELWDDSKYVKSVLRSLYTMNMKYLDDDALLKLIKINKYIASQFKPCVAKFIYDTFKSQDVLDFSSGWGDRLCGFYVSNAKSYFGIDPNTSVFKNYFKQIEFYEKFIHKEVHLENLPAEDVDLGDRMFDTVFTSPPYFKTERYCDEDTQSYKRYTELDTWINKFLFTVLKNSWDHLKNNGYLILNISDRIKYKWQICDKMNDYISQFPQSSYCGCIGLKMPKRPGSRMLSERNKEDVFGEPIWIWHKGNKTELNEIFKSQSIDEW